MDVQFEMNKVSWPNWEELKGSTYVVLSLSLILTVFLFFVESFCVPRVWSSNNKPSGKSQGNNSKPKTYILPLIPYILIPFRGKVLPHQEN